MSSLVFCEVCVLAEGSSTLAAFVRFLSRVNPLVLDERRALAEGLPALAALVWLLPGVALLVLRQGGTVTEGFATFIAHVRFHSVRFNDVRSLPEALCS